MMKDDIYQTAEQAFGVPGYAEATKQAQIARLAPKQKLVYDAIKENPEAANDDAILLAAVWEKEGWIDGLGLYYNLRHVSRPETLSRRRRQLHQMGLIEYSEKADKGRMEAFTNERDRHTSSPTVKIVKGEKVVNLAPQYVNSLELEGYNTRRKLAREDDNIARRGMSPVNVNELLAREQPGLL